MQMGSSIPFSLNYNALKMFGRQLYSNAWAAISELVANGFDANAANVYLYIDMINKKDANIELLDNGSGMDENDLRSKYVIIGRNRRLYNPEDTAAGRKGIGKLAALYLSDNYNIISKKDGKVTGWSVDVSDIDDTSTPSLEEIDTAEIDVVCREIWDSASFENGTLIQLKNVNLSRLSDAAIEALKHKLSNYFLFDTMENKLKICIQTYPMDKFVFEDMYKQIAFDNMVYVYCSDEEYIDVKKEKFEVSYKNKLGYDKTLPMDRSIEDFPEEVKSKDSKEKIKLEGTKEFYGVKKIIDWRAG